MTHKIQISKRLPDGTILVLGADTPEEFGEVVRGVVSPAGAEYIFDMFVRFAETDTWVPVADGRRLRIGEAKPSSKSLPRGDEW